MLPKVKSLRFLKENRGFWAPTAGAPVTQVPHFRPQPPSPLTSKTDLSKRRVTLERSSANDPHAGPRRGRRICRPAASAADPKMGILDCFLLWK